MRSYLSRLAQRKDLQLGVLSDQPNVAIDHLTDAYAGIFKLFKPELILISAKIDLSKKDEDLAIYKLAVQKAGLEPGQTLFVDNSLHNIENAAKTA
jgi:FMN phosphatase YigB (HAD superfamily)